MVILKTLIQKYDAYLIVAYGGLTVLNICTDAEHRTLEKYTCPYCGHRRSRVIVLLFLNNNFHAVCHMHPEISWYALPALYTE